MPAASALRRRVHSSVNRIRTIARSFILPGLCSLALTAQAAQTLTVTTTADDVTTPPAGSLRKAIADAADGDTIEFNVSVTGAITLAGTELLLDKNLTITGPGAATLAVSGNQQSRIFRIPAGKTVAISGLTIRDGKAPNGTDLSFRLGGTAPDGQSGGGIYNEGLLTLTNCRITNNSAGRGGNFSADYNAQAGNGGSGGAVLNAGGLILTNCRLDHNHAGSGGSAGSMGSKAGIGGHGGAIHSLAQGGIELLNCILSENSAGEGGIGSGALTLGCGLGGNGGAVSVTGGTAVLEGCSLVRCMAGNGGAFTFNFPGAGSAGAGGSGGGIYIGSGTVTLKTSTISGNGAGNVSNVPANSTKAGDGGGIACLGGTANLISCTITDNVAGDNLTEIPYENSDGRGGGLYSNGGTVTIGNTIVAGNRNYSDFSGTFVDGGHNIISAVSPMLAPLGEYGGPTPTHALLAGSPAIDAGDDSITGSDQRGQSRLVGSHVDIGSFEGVVPNVLSLAVDSVEVDETVGTVTITVQRTGDTTSSASATFSTLPGSAKEPDYTAVSGTLEFEPGQTQAVIQVPIIDDSTPESPETFQIRLASASPTTAIFPRGLQTVTISDNEGPAILSFTTASSTIAEAGGNALISVQRKNDGAVGTVSVHYFTTTAASAASPYPASDNDYRPVSGTLIFGPGITQQTVVVPILDDAQFELDETFYVLLSEPTGGATLGTQKSQIIVIANDDPRPPPPPSPTFDFQVAASSISESSGNVLIKIIRSKVLTGDVSVSYQTSAGTAEANSDFIPAAGILNFPSSSTEQTIVVPIVNNDAIENTETFTVTLSDPTNGAVLGTQITHTVTIADNDGPATVAFSGTSSNVGEASGSAAAVTLIRSGNTTTSATVEVSAQPGSAHEGTDYTFTNIAVTFAPGETQKTVMVPIADDAAEEGNEQFQLVLSNPSEGATLGEQNTHTITILANDSPAIVAFASASSTVHEFILTPTAITLLRFGETATSATVQVSAQPGSAHDGTDYTFESTTVTFAPGETQKTVMISTIDDTVDEADEQFTLVLSNPGSGVDLGSQTTHTVTILDDAGDLPEFAKASYHGLGVSTVSTPVEYAAISITTTDSGQLTGALQVRGRTVRFQGRFSETGVFTHEFRQRSLGAIAGSSLELQLQSAGAIVDGTFRTFNGTTFDVELKRDVVATNANPVAEANGYTALLQTQLPGNAAGFLRTRVLPAGKISLSGMLPDGTRLSGSSHLAEDRTFPILFPAYAKKRGHLAGTAQIVSADALPLTGDLHWHKPANSRPPYAAGLTDEAVDLSGNVYTPPERRHRALDDFDATQGTASFKTSTAADPNPVGINAMWNQDNTIRILPPEFRRPPSSIRFSFQPKTGLFTGVFRDAENHPNKFFGICVQQAEAGADQTVGFFLSGEAAGRIELVPQPPQ